MSLGKTKAGEHTSLMKYTIVKNDYSHKNIKAKALGHVDGIRTFVVLTVGSDLLQSHETFNFVTL